MPLTNAEVAREVRDSLNLVQIGNSPKEVQNAKDFYKFFFTNFPDLRKYFKGAENYTAEDVQKSERFEKQGQRLLLAVYILANTFEDESVFRANVREMVNRHRQFKLDPALWAAFFTVYVTFLESRGKVTDQQKEAWKQMGKIFDEEAQSHLKDMGLPHV